ncbi:MAG: hypothetical protein QM775_00205 [Pirellulales bacterium]
MARFAAMKLGAGTFDDVPKPIIGSQVQPHDVMVAFDRFAAGPGQQSLRRAGMFGRGDELQDAIVALHDVADDRIVVEIEVEALRAGQRHEDVLRRLPADEPAPVSFRTFVRPGGPGGLFAVESHQRRQFDVPPRANI